ncbi:MAG: VanZ family protein [Betaproteobacteria bacterium]|nr:VanZ family protein [Betaproteobacteria bacterium]
MGRRAEARSVAGEFGRDDRGRPRLNSPLHALMSDTAHADRPPPEARRGGFSPHTVRLAWILAVAYLLVIAYASLQPFRGWRMPPPEILHFSLAPWPRYITLEDIAVNLAAYAPLGFLLSIGCGARYGAPLGALAAALAAALLSLALEAAQMFLPARIASNVDLLTNGLGALVGAMAAPLFAPTRIFGSRLHRARHRLFHAGMAADAGFVILCLWLLTQFHPTVQLFGSGRLRATFELPAYAVHTPQLAFSAEAAVAALTVTALGLLCSALMRSGQRLALPIAMLIGAAIAIKAFTAIALVRTPSPLSWLTPGVVLGLLAGAALIYALARVGTRAKLVLAALSIVAATTAINLAPANPYQSIPPQLLAGGQSHFLNFSAIVRALSELWPLLAVSYLAYALGARRADGS